MSKFLNTLFVTLLLLAPSAQAVEVRRFANTVTAKNFAPTYTTTATAAGTTTLTNASNHFQVFTGSTTQTVVLPVASTLELGQNYRIVNDSSGVVTVQSSGANTLQAMAANTELVATTILQSGTGTASWSWVYRSKTAGIFPGNTTSDSNLGTISSVTNGSFYVGTFTLNMDGALNANSAQSVSYNKVGRMVTISIPLKNGTCDSAAAIVSGAGDIPSALRPFADVKYSVNGVYDAGGADINSAMQITSAGTVSIYGNAAGGNFTISGAGCGWDRAINVSYFSAN